MFRTPVNLGMWQRRYGGLRRWVLSLLAKKPLNGVEIMDELEEMSLGWWRPSPGSVYPLLSELLSDGFVKKRSDGRYELTAKAKEDSELPGYYKGPRTVKEVVREIGDYLSYLEDLRQVRSKEIDSASPELVELSDRLRALARK